MQGTASRIDRLQILKHDLEDENAVGVSEKLFGDEVFDMLVLQTNIYVSQINKQDFLVSKADLKLFIEILLLTGYHKLPSERNYWSLDEDIAENNNLDKGDKMAKVRPLVTILNQKFQQWGICHEQLSTDKAMVKLFERYSSKQYIKNTWITLFFYNYFTSNSLLKTLRECGQRATGTIRKNRSKSVL